MPKPFYRIIDFPSYNTKNGTLFMYQLTNKKNGGVPFGVKRTLIIRDMKESDVRGGHTHHKTHQILICANGKCSVDLDDGKRKETIVLDSANQGLLLYPYVWHTMHDFKPDTVLVVLTDREYDEKEYIRNYNDFIQQL